MKSGEDNMLAEAIQMTCSGDSSRAGQLLGWLPKRRGFVAGMDVYAKAFVAAQKKI